MAVFLVTQENWEQMLTKYDENNNRKLFKIQIWQNMSKPSTAMVYVNLKGILREF